MRLLLDPHGEELQVLVIKEAVHVMEAIVLASAIDTYNSIPYFMRVWLNADANGPLKMSNVELKSLMDLRDQVFRIWGLLQTSNSFDPELLQPVLQVRLKLYRNSMMLYFIDKLYCSPIFGL